MTAATITARTVYETAHANLDAGGYTLTCADGVVYVADPEVVSEALARFGGVPASPREALVKYLKVCALDDYNPGPARAILAKYAIE